LAVAPLSRRAKLVGEAFWVLGHKEGVTPGQMGEQRRPDIIGLTDKKPMMSAKNPVYTRTGGGVPLPQSIYDAQHPRPKRDIKSQR
jgi:hypothetical protein